MEKLLNNKWLLYGGAAVAALGLVWAFSGTGASTAEEDTTSSMWPVALTPSLSGYGASGDAAASGNSGFDLSGLIALENKKTDVTRELTLAEIDANLKTTLNSNAVNLAVAGIQADALNLQAFSSIFNSATKLYLPNTNAVAGAFNYNGKTFDFSTLRIAGMPTNERAITALDQYRGISNVPNTANATSVAQLPTTSAPSASSAGRSANLAPLSSVVAGREQARRARAGVLGTA